MRRVLCHEGSARGGVRRGIKRACEAPWGGFGDLTCVRACTAKRGVPRKGREGPPQKEEDHWRRSPAVHFPCEVTLWPPVWVIGLIAGVGVLLCDLK